jgi:hypothetical protein
MELIFGSDVSRQRLNIDWSLIGASAFAAALVLGSMVRTGPEPLPGSPAVAGGLQVLAAHQRLVSFEDFNFGADGWTVARPPVGTRGAASVLGPFAGGAVAKRFTLPPDTAWVELTFDLNLHGGWTGEGLSISVDGEQVIADVARAAGEGGSRNAVIRRGADGGHTVRIAMENRRDTILLVLDAAASADALWSIDNVSVVASAPDS